MISCGLSCQEPIAGLLRARHLLLDQRDEERASKDFRLRADMGKASLSGLVMQADKRMFILDHSF